MQRPLRLVLFAFCLRGAAATADYVLNKTDTKCAYKNSDRLFRVEDKELADCYDLCSSTTDCNYFSIALTGRYTGVCMGCTVGITDPHDNFNFYTMGAPAAPASSPPASGLVGLVLDESDFIPNTKCAYQHPDRLFRIEGSSLQDCYTECLNVESCNYFSVAEEGPYAGVCMGCVEGVQQPHEFFKFFAMPGTNEAPPNEMAHCPEMPYEQRVDCGWWGVTPEKCMEKGCCWQVDPVPNPNHIPYCYRLHTAWPGCDQDNGLKTDCGYWGIGADECEQRGCCFRASPNPNPENIPWCFPPSE